MGVKRYAIIFDGDDTLWCNQTYYDQAMDRFFDLMELQGFPRSQVKQKFDEIDRLNVNKLMASKSQFSKKRFPQSMADTYHYFCRATPAPVSESVEKQSLQIGEAVFQIIPQLMDGATALLEFLKDSGRYKLYLWTAGDIEVQQNKLESVSLSPFFDKIYISPSKDSDSLHKIIDEQHLDTKRTWMIGNSWASDIEPALKVGFRCIWIQGRSWSYDNSQIILGECFPVWRLAEIPAILKEYADRRRKLPKVSQLPLNLDTPWNITPPRHTRKEKVDQGAIPESKQLNLLDR